MAPPQTNLEPRVSALETKVATLESKVATVESNVATLTTRVTTVETSLAQNASDDAALEDRVAALEGGSPPPSGTTVDARTFSPDGPHAGTAADPWPAVAIQSAIDAAAPGDIVSVADGIWLVNSVLQVEKSNFTLQGESFAAEIRIVGDGQFWFSNITGVTFKVLTWNCSGQNTASPRPGFRVSNGVNCVFTGNKVIGHANGGMPGTNWEGGSGNRIQNSTFEGGAVGGDNTLQIQPLGGTADRDFVISDNVFRDTQLVAIGISDLQILRNTLTTSFGMIAIMVCGKWDVGITNVLVDDNTVDAGGANGATITGLPNDPGGASVIDGFTISNNRITGTFAAIHAQSMDGNNYLDNTLLGNTKKNVHIVGNTLTSAWGASGVNIRGGAGFVDIVEVRNNTFVNAPGAVGHIDQDAHTTNVTISGNVGL